MQFQSPDNKMHPEDRRNLVVFAVLSLVVWFVFDHFMLGPQLERMKAAQQAQQSRPMLADVKGGEGLRPREAIVAEDARVKLANSNMYGSIALVGGRLDDIRLTRYYKTIEKKENVTLLTPPGAQYAKYVEFGWLAGDGATEGDMPNKDTVWTLSGDSAKELKPGTTLTLVWNNAKGLKFTRKITLDDDSMFMVTQTVTNNSGATVTLYPYSFVAQRGVPEEYYGATRVHEGPIGYIGNELVEHNYVKIAKEPRDERSAYNGWIGITEKYWLTSLIPTQGEDVKYRFLYTPSAYADQEPLYQTDAVASARVVKPGETAENVQHVFVGAKEISALNGYEKSLGVKHFDLAVDFGLWYFLTKPLFYLLDFLAKHVGNFGIAIIILTIIVRSAVFPLANASFRSFAKMKKIAPQMTELREKYAGDKERLQKELVILYEKEKVNPMSGCFPLLVQIPIFFALFKVFSVTIEMRHAPFYGWIHDLSMPDPTSVFNLFGLLPWNPPAALMIGVWPCLMLFFMRLQYYLNPPPTDKTQAIMVQVMPFFLTYILSKYASGLVIYWTFSNMLSIIQQVIIMRSMGVEIHLFSRSKAEKELEEQVKHGPDVHPDLVVAGEEIEEALGVEDAKTVSAPKPKKKKKR